VRLKRAACTEIPTASSCTCKRRAKARRTMPESRSVRWVTAAPFLRLRATFSARRRRETPLLDVAVVVRLRWRLATGRYLRPAVVRPLGMARTHRGRARPHAHQSPGYAWTTSQGGGDVVLARYDFNPARGRGGRVLAHARPRARPGATTSCPAGAMRLAPPRADRGARHRRLPVPPAPARFGARHLSAGDARPAPAHRSGRRDACTSPR